MRPLKLRRLLKESYLSQNQAEQIKIFAKLFNSFRKRPNKMLKAFQDELKIRKLHFQSLDMAKGVYKLQLRQISSALIQLVWPVQSKLNGYPRFYKEEIIDKISKQSLLEFKKCMVNFCFTQKGPLDQKFAFGLFAFFEELKESDESEKEQLLNNFLPVTSFEKIVKLKVSLKLWKIEKFIEVKAQTYFLEEIQPYFNENDLQIIYEVHLILYEYIFKCIQNCNASSIYKQVTQLLIFSLKNLGHQDSKNGSSLSQNQRRDCIFTSNTNTSIKKRGISTIDFTGANELYFDFSDPNVWIEEISKLISKIFEIVPGVIQQLNYTEIVEAFNMNIVNNYCLSVLIQIFKNSSQYIRNKEEEYNKLLQIVENKMINDARFSYFYFQDKRVFEQSDELKFEQIIPSYFLFIEISCNGGYHHIKHDLLKDLPLKHSVILFRQEQFFAFIKRQFVNLNSEREDKQLIAIATFKFYAQYQFEYEENIDFKKITLAVLKLRHSKCDIIRWGLIELANTIFFYQRNNIEQFQEKEVYRNVYDFIMNENEDNVCIHVLNLKMVLIFFTQKNSFINDQELDIIYKKLACILCRHLRTVAETSFHIPRGYDEQNMLQLMKIIFIPLITIKEQESNENITTFQDKINLASTLIKKFWGHGSKIGNILDLILENTIKQFQRGISKVFVFCASQQLCDFFVYVIKSKQLKLKSEYGFLIYEFLNSDIIPLITEPKYFIYYKIRIKALIYADKENKSLLSNFKIAQFRQYYHKLGSQKLISQKLHYLLNELIQSWEVLNLEWKQLIKQFFQITFIDSSRFKNARFDVLRTVNEVQNQFNIKDFKSEFVNMFWQQLIQQANNIVKQTINENFQIQSVYKAFDEIEFLRRIIWPTQPFLCESEVNAWLRAIEILRKCVKKRFKNLTSMSGLKTIQSLQNEYNQSLLFF